MSEQSQLDQADAAAIFKLGQKFDMQREAMQHVTKCESFESFREQVLGTVLAKHNRKNLESVGVKQDRKQDRFSLSRYILAKADQNPLHSIERDSLADYQRNIVDSPSIKGEMVPMHVINQISTSKRDLTASTNTAGGYTIDDELRDLITPLDAATPAYSLSRKIFVKGRFSIPTKTESATAQWVSETGAPAETNIVFGDKQATPKYLRAWTSVSKELLKQSDSIDSEQFVRDDLRVAIQQGIEKGIVQGAGSGSEPLGLQNNTGITSVTRASASAVTYDEVEQVEEAILDGNAIVFNDMRREFEFNTANISDSRIRRTTNNPLLAWTVSPKLRRLMRKTPQLGVGTSQPIWDTGDQDNGAVLVRGQGTSQQPKVLDWDAYVSNHVAQNDLFLGAWQEHIVAQSGGLDIVVDPFTLSHRGLIRVTAHLSLDFVLRHDEAIARLTA